MADELKRFFEHVVDVHRREDRLGRAGETQKLIHQRIDPIDLVPDQVRKGFPEIGVLITLRQKLGKRLDGDERVLDLVGHAGRERTETREPVAAANLQFEALQRGDIGEDNERAEHFTLLTVKNRAAGADYGVVIAERQNQLAVFLPVAGAQSLAKT